MIDKDLLSGKIRGCGLKQSEVAAKIGISSQSLSLKINNKSEFKLDEVIALCAILNITDEKESIFFAKSLEKSSNDEG